MLVQEDANLAGSFRFVSVANLARISSLEIVRWSSEIKPALYHEIKRKLAHNLVIRPVIWLAL